MFLFNARLVSRKAPLVPSLVTVNRCASPASHNYAVRAQTTTRTLPVNMTGGRCYSSKPSPKPSSSQKNAEPIHVDQVLKKFYKKVHPDLFTKEPEKRAVNDKSFALLQGYLDLMRDSKTSSGEIGDRFTLNFYTTDAEKPATLEVVLPRLDSQHRQKERHMQQTLLSLFTRCKFAYDPFYVSLNSKDVEKYARPGDLTLINFLLQTVARQQPKNQKKAAVQERLEREQKTGAYLQTVLQEMSDANGIAKFAFSVREHLFLPLADRYTTRIGLAYKLKQALLESSSVALQGVVINFTGQLPGVDINGHLCLPHNASIQDWAAIISSYSKEHAAGTVEKEKARLELEKTLCGILGIQSWSSTPELRSDLQYRSLLNTTIGALRRKNWELPAGVQDMRIVIDKVKEADTHPGTGSLILPADSTPKDIQEYLMANAKQVMDEKRMYAGNISYVKERLGLKDLTFLPHPELSFEQLHSCLTRLHTHQAMIKPYMQNLKIVITTEYGYNPESSTVAIRWDYLIDRP